MTESTDERLRQLLEETSPQAQEVLGEVLRREREKLHMKRAHGIVQDLTDVVKALVK